MYVQSLQGIFIQHMGFHCIPRKTNKNVGLLIQIILNNSLYCTQRQSFNSHQDETHNDYYMITVKSYV